MGEVMEILINLGVPLFLIVLGLIIGSVLEKKHFESIRLREKETLGLPVTTIKSIEDERVVASSRLVTGSVVISIDHFKRFLAGLRNIFGGRIVAYESLVDRARREAILRMKSKFSDADVIVNLRIETSSISKNSRKGSKSVGCVEVIAYGTAIKYI